MHTVATTRQKRLHLKEAVTVAVTSDSDEPRSLWYPFTIYANILTELCRIPAVLRTNSE